MILSDRRIGRRFLAVGLSILGVATGILLGNSTALAELSAADTVTTVVDEVRQTVAKEEGSLSPEKLDEKLRDIIAPVFDFKTMARSSLAKHWSSATEQEQTEFVELFSDLLAKTYLKRIRENAAESKVVVLGEKKRGTDKVVVATKVNYDKDQTASINYRMRHKGDSWLVYDVIIENIGLVSNYRQEFDGIVKKEKISGLIERLRKKNS